MKRFVAYALLMLIVLVASNFALEAKYDLNAHIPLSPKITTGKLDNGLTYFIMENSKPENRAEIQIIVRAGSVHEDDHQAGLAHFLEHMAFNGTKNFPKDSLIKFLESTGVRFGADLNAGTSFEYTHYMLTIPLDKPNMLEGGMQVLEDWAMWISFDSLEIEKERGVILEEKRVRTNFQSRLMDIFLPVIFKGSKLAERMPIGKEEIISTAPRQAFVDFYEDWYRPDIAAVIVVGDLKTNDALALIKKHFNHWKFKGKGTPKPNTVPPIPDNKEPLISIAYDKELPYANAVLYIKHKGRDERTYGAYRETLKEQLFGMMLNMRLQELTREAAPPFLYAGAGVSDFLGGIRIFNFVAVPNAGDFANGFERGLAEVFRADQHGFTPTELARAKETVLAQYERNYNERDKTESSSLARELAGYFREDEAVPGIEVEFELAKHFLAEIQIAEVNKMVADLITPENVVFTIALPEGGADKPTEADILAIFKKAENAKYEAYVDDLGDGQLMKTLPKKGKITSTKKLPNFDITEMKLSNGARVLLKPTDFKNDQILFSCWADGGTSLYSDQDYFIANSADAITVEGGLGEFKATLLTKLLQSKMVRLSPYISDYSQGMQGSSTPKDKEIFFQLLNMRFTQPRKDAEAFQSYITKTAELLRTRDRDPENAFRDTIGAVLGGYSPRSFPMTEDHLEKFELDKAFKIYQERFADAANFTFLFVGAFTIDEMRPLIEQYIASLPATNKKEKAKDLGIKAPSGQVAKVVNAGIEPKATVRLIIDVDKVTYNSDEILKMNVMNEIMNIRLREEVREEKGGTYGIGGRTTMNYFPRQFVRTQIYWGTNPGFVEELIDEVKKVFDEMQKEISAENLNKAKEIMKNEFQTRSKENNYWLGVIQQFDYTNRDLAFLKDYANRIDKITTADVVASAKKYLDYKTNFIRIVLLPEEDDE